MLPSFIPFEPKSFFDLRVSFSTPFSSFRSWCGRRHISKISKDENLLSRSPSIISPGQSYFDDLRALATQIGIYEDGNFVCRTMSDVSILLTGVLDFAAKRVIPSPADDTKPSKSLTDFDVVPCNILCQGMEAWALEQKSSPGKPYMIALYLLPVFCRSDALEDFIATPSLSHEPASRSGPRASFTQAETMWSMIYDACVSSQCTSFVLSSYSRWVFGEFTTDFSKADVSQIIDFSCKSPSVPEALCQWIGHAQEMAKRSNETCIGPTDQDELPLAYVDMEYNHRHMLHILREIQ